MLPLVSVITPFKDRLPLLEECLESVKNQTYQNNEVFLIDDASKQNYESRFREKYEGVFPFRYLRNSENLGPGPSRQRGLEQAQGKYILYLDSDDVLHPQMIEKCAKYLEENPECGMCYVISLEFLESAELRNPALLKVRKRSDRFIGENIIYEMLKTRRVWDTSACFWRKAAIHSFKPWTNLQNYEDYTYDANLDLQRIRVGWVGEKLCYYRMYPGKDDMQNPALHHGKMGMLLYLSNWLYETQFFPRKREIQKMIFQAFVKLQLHYGQPGKSRPPVIQNCFLRLLATHPFFRFRLPLRILNKIILICQ